MIVLALSHGAHVAVRVLAGVIGATVAASVFLSAVRTVVVPRAAGQRITQLTFVITHRVFEWYAHERRSYEARDRALALYAPLTLILLPAVWMALTIMAFTAVHWALEGGAIHDAYLMSGSSMLTLGSISRHDRVSATVGFVQASLGLVLVALLISYLPTIYGAFSRRESMVGMLESRAGLPPSPVRMLVRYVRIGTLDTLNTDLFPRWEQWFVDIEETHSSFPSLIFFRSPRSDRSWITAAGCVLDTSALYESAVDVPTSPRAALCLRSGFLALRRIADNLGITYDPDPRPDDPISVTREEFDEACRALAEQGVPLTADRDQAWRDFQGWRVNYDRVLVALATMVVAPVAPWSSDRDVPRVVPGLNGVVERRARRRA